MNNIGNILLKIVILLVLISIMLCTFNNYFVYAEDFNANDYKPNQNEVDKRSEDVLKRVGKSAIGPIRIVGSFASVFGLIIIGIKYMLGSIEEKAEYKKTLLPYLIGAIMVFGIINIVGILYDLAVGI